MKLINIKNGDEYTIREEDLPKHHSLYSKKYEKREGFTSIHNKELDCVTPDKAISDTHRAICFLEPLEKPNDRKQS